MSKVCTKCGTSYSDNNKFCPVCGSPLKTMDEVVRNNNLPPTQPNAPDSEKQGLGCLVSFFFIVLIMVVFLGVIISPSTDYEDVEVATEETSENATTTEESSSEVEQAEKPNEERQRIKEEKTQVSADELRLHVKNCHSKMLCETPKTTRIKTL